MTLADIMRDGRLRAHHRDFVRLLHRITSRIHDECWYSTARLADFLGKTERTVQSYLSWLERLGVVRVVRDYGLRSRHRIILLWRRGTAAGPLFPEPPDFRQSAKKISPSGEPPLEPPLEEPEGATSETTDAEPVVVTSVASPDPEETKTIAAEVQAAFNTTATAAIAQAKALLSVYCPDWVRRAIDVTKAAAAAGEIQKSVWGYLRGVLGNWQREGGPAPAAERIRASKWQELLANLAARKQAREVSHAGSS